MTGKKSIIGKRLTKRTATEFEDGSVHVSLDMLQRFEPAKLKAAAIAALEDQGIPAATILAEHPGGSMLRDHVLNRAGHDLDSRAGIACQVCEQCIRIEQLPALGALPAMLMAEAFRLGQLVILAKAYGIEAEQSRAAAKAPRPGRRSALRAQVVDLMRSYSSSGAEFKDFMKAWAHDRVLQGLAIEVCVQGEHAGKYLVTDENANEDSSQPYTWGSLMKLYSAP